MKHIRLLLLLLLLPLSFCPLGAYSQNDSAIYNESVLIRGNFNPVIDRFDKINVPPAITDTSSALDYHFSYQLDPHRLSSIFVPSKFKPVRVVGEPRTRLYNSYLRLGFGNYWSPLLDAYYNSVTSHNLNYGIRLNHRSSWGTIGNEDKPETYYGKNHFSLTDIALFGKYIIGERMQVFTDLAYQNDYNLYYGFNDTTLNRFNLNRDDLKTADYKAPYNHIGWNIGVKNISTASRLDYDARVFIGDLMGAYGQNEFNFRLDGGTGYRLRLSKGNDLLAALRLSLDGYSQNIDNTILQPFLHISDTMTTWQPDSSYTPHSSRLLLGLNPYAELSLAGIRVHAGLRVALDRYGERGVMNTYIFPDVTLSRSFMNDALGITIGAVGNDEAVSWNDIRMVNPYVMPCAQVESYRYNNFFGRVRYNFSKKLELNAHVAYMLYDNRLSFLPNPEYLLGNVFGTKYESGQQLTVGADFSFVNDEMIALAVGGNYYHHVAVDGDSLPSLYLPPFDMHFRADVNYHDRMLLHLQFMLLGAMDANFEYDAAAAEYVITETVPLRYGMNIEFEYRHNKALSAFLRIDNLLFQRYYYWQNYPSQRAVFTIGATYTIPTK